MCKLHDKVPIVTSMVVQGQRQPDLAARSPQDVLAFLLSEDHEVCPHRRHELTYQGQVSAACPIVAGQRTLPLLLHWDGGESPARMRGRLGLPTVVVLNLAQASWCSL